MDVTKINKLGWKAEISLTNGIKKTIGEAVNFF
jgi:nucleoside-diphosphate-sugar epimerase